jgi:superfamily II DNA or RNA helicase
MSGISKKTLEHDKVLTMFRLRGSRGAVIAGTGFGKSRIGTRAIREVTDTRPALILVPFDHLKQRFKDEFECTGGMPELEVEMECYASIDRLDPMKYSIIVCDEIHLGLTDRCLGFYMRYLKGSGKALFLTATLPDDPIYEGRLRSLVPIVYQISLDECVKKGFIAPYHIECIGIDLTEDEQKLYSTVSRNYGYWKGFLGFSPFQTAQSILKNPRPYSERQKAAAVGLFRAIRQRKGLVDHAFNKIAISAQLVTDVKGRKLIFGGDNAFTDLLSSNISGSVRYHSKMKKKENLEALRAFKEGDSDILCSTKALNQGLDVPDASIGIVCGLTSKPLTMVQRVGRLVRIDPKDPKKTGKVIIVYVKGSQEEKWLRNALQGLNSENIIWTDGTTIQIKADDSKEQHQTRVAISGCATGQDS